MMDHYSNKEEKELIHLLRQSDQKAFNALFRLYSVRVYRFAYGYLKSREEAEEIIQEAFIKIWQGRTAIDASHSFSGFVFTIAYHLILNRIRKIRNQNHYRASLEKSGNHSHNETEEKVLLNDLELMSQTVLIELPPKRKIIYQMIREEGMTYKQVAEQLNISVKTVEAQMTEALKYFRKRLSL